MTDDPKHKYHDVTVSEWIDEHTDRLKDNGSGLWDITSPMDSFDLTGNKRIDFVRRSILSLIHAGGRPVVAHETKPIWIETFQYGIQPEEIADNVIAEWLSEGGSDDVEWGRWWFAYPDCHR
jgi:hypothetical protein